MDREVGESILRVEEIIYKRTSVSSTRSRQKMRIKVDVSNYTMEGIIYRV